MSRPRPYRSHSLDALFLLAREHWDTIHFLRILHDELAHRTTAAARERSAEIAHRVAALEAADSGVQAARQDRAEVARLRAEAEAARRRIDDLQAVLRQAHETIRTLQRDLAAASTPGGAPLFRRVGLDENCPDFVLKAVRTAYRKTLHPDGRAAHEKAAAEARFKEAESVFDTLYALRQL